MDQSCLPNLPLKTIFTWRVFRLAIYWLCPEYQFLGREYTLHPHGNVLGVDPITFLWFALALLLIGPSIDQPPGCDRSLCRTQRHRSSKRFLLLFTNLCRARVSLLAHRLAGKCHCDSWIFSFAVQFESGKWLVPFFLFLLGCLP